MGDVLAFGQVDLPNEPCADVVQVLEDLLAEAKSGNLRAVAYATARADDVTGSGWSGGVGTRHPLAAAIMMLQARYAAALQEG